MHDAFDRAMHLKHADAFDGTLSDGTAMKPVDRLRMLMTEFELGAIVLSRRDNFSWITEGGSSAIVETSETGVAALLVTQNEIFLITNEIEADRLLQEETTEVEATVVSFPWYESQGDVIALLAKGHRTASDTAIDGFIDISNMIERRRSLLSTEEIARYRELGHQASACVESVLRSVTRGATEREIAAEVVHEALLSGIRPSAVLVGVDDRLFKFRHPTPTDRQLDTYVMVVLCGERHGLIANTTRFVHFGPMPNDLSRRHEQTARILANLNSATVPGTSYQQLWGVLLKEYANAGVPDEWKMHHQGGLCGYAPREWLLEPTTEGEVARNQAFAWNPSITGAKSEETIIATNDGYEAITLNDTWPVMESVIDTVSRKTAAVLEVSR